MPFGELLERLLGARRLMLGADAGREIGIEGVAAQQRRVAVDVAVLEGRELGEHDGILREHAREIHELGEPDDLGMRAERQEIADLEPRARGLEMRSPARSSRAARGCP